MFNFRNMNLQYQLKIHFSLWEGYLSNNGSRYNFSLSPHPQGPCSAPPQPSILETCALIMKIICLEIYYVVK